MAPGQILNCTRPIAVEFSPNQIEATMGTTVEGTIDIVAHMWHPTWTGDAISSRQGWADNLIAKSDHVKLQLYLPPGVKVSGEDWKPIEISKENQAAAEYLSNNSWSCLELEWPIQNKEYLLAKIPVSYQLSKLGRSTISLKVMLVRKKKVIWGLKDYLPGIYDYWHTDVFCK